VVVGSQTEVETQLEIASNLDYLEKRTASDLLSKSSEIGRMLNGLRAWTKNPESER